MERKFELLPCIGLSDRCPAVKRADKFAQEIEESANSLQQLKAEIAALADKIDSAWTACDFNEHRRLTNAMRQLSAV